MPLICRETPGSGCCRPGWSSRPALPRPAPLPPLRRLGPSKASSRALQRPLLSILPGASHQRPPGAAQPLPSPEPPSAAKAKTPSASSGQERVHSTRISVRAQLLFFPGFAASSPRWSHRCPQALPTRGPPAAFKVSALPSSSHLPRQETKVIPTTHGSFPG